MEINAEQDLKGIVNKYQPIVMSLSGSRLYGTSNAESDKDYIGIYIEPVQDLIGFKSEASFSYRSAELREGVHNAKSTSKDIDLTLYGLRKFVQMACVGNPNIWPVLFTNRVDILTPMGKELREHVAQKVITKQLIKATFGMVNNQLERAARISNNIEYKPQISALTTLYMLSDILAFGCMRLPLDDSRVSAITKIKQGAYSNSDVSVIVRDRLDHLSRYLQADNIPDTADYNNIETWMILTYLQEWAKTSQQKVVDPNGEIENSVAFTGQQTPPLVPPAFMQMHNLQNSIPQPWDQLIGNATTLFTGNRS